MLVFLNILVVLETAQSYDIRNNFCDLLNRFVKEMLSVISFQFSVISVENLKIEWFKDFVEKK
jgi:hypothetical protein